MDCVRLALWLSDCLISSLDSSFFSIRRCDYMVSVSEYYLHRLLLLAGHFLCLPGCVTCLISYLATVLATISCDSFRIPLAECNSSTTPKDYSLKFILRFSSKHLTTSDNTGVIISRNTLLGAVIVGFSC